MEPPEKWPVASLSPKDLLKLQQLESQIQADGGKNVVLVAYQQE